MCDNHSDSFFLNYNNDVRSAVGQVVGPDIFGGRYEIIDAEYDEAANKTRVELEVYNG